jgi:hypothetical protein
VSACLRDGRPWSGATATESSLSPSKAPNCRTCANPLSAPAGYTSPGPTTPRHVETVLGEDGTSGGLAVLNWTGWADTAAGQTARRAPQPRLWIVSERYWRRATTRLTDTERQLRNVCFAPESGHRNSVVECPLCAKSRLMHCSKRARIGTKFSVRSPA